MNGQSGSTCALVVDNDHLLASCGWLRVSWDIDFGSASTFTSASANIRVGVHTWESLENDYPSSNDYPLDRRGGSSRSPVHLELEMMPVQLMIMIHPDGQGDQDRGGKKKNFTF